MCDYCTALHTVRYCSLTVFSLGQEVADALLAECDQLLRAGAARSELPQLGLLQQLGWLASYSHEVFGDLTREAEASYGRVVALKHRLHRVTERLARVDDALAAASETEIANICAANPGGAAR